MNGLGGSYAERNIDNAEANVPETVSLGDSLVISSINILLVPFWTLTMPTWLNIAVMLPLRALGWILLIWLIRGAS